MRQNLSRTAFVVLIVMSFAGGALAQATPPRPSTPLRIQIVIARYDGSNKQIISSPYSLLLSANERPGVSLRMGSQLPVPSGNGGVQYMNVGTNIDCTATSTDDGRFKLEVQIEDTSVIEHRRVDIVTIPSLRNFTTSNIVFLRDGQSTQFTVATDKVTGETMRVDVTLDVGD